jgi:hypothetical protein
MRNLNTLELSGHYAPLKEGIGEEKSMVWERKEQTENDGKRKKRASRNFKRKKPGDRRTRYYET